MKVRTCRECGRQFTGANNAVRCPECRAEKQRENALKHCVDDLTLDVREADAAGVSYGQWRIRKLLEKQKAREKREAEMARRRKEKNERKPERKEQPGETVREDVLDHE